MKKPRILFLNHSASRNGASILLLDLIKWMKTHSELESEVLTLGRGPLLGDFSSTVRTIVLPRPATDLLSSSAEGVSVSLARRVLTAITRMGKYDLIYANTAATWHVAAEARRLSRPVLWHIHELGYGLRSTLGATAARSRLAAGNRFVAVSRAVEQTLTDDFGIPSDKVTIVHGFANMARLGREERREKRAELLSALAWPEDAFVVGACGSLGWRKGSDLFLQVADHLRDLAQNARLRFLWVGGGDESSDETLRFRFDATAMGLDSFVRHIPSQTDVLNYYAAMNVLALTSREDPFPLVVLEAGLQGIPTVCFGAAGGAPEFVGKDAGMVVPYPKVELFAKAIRVLHGDTELLTRQGQHAQEQVTRSHSIDSQAPKLLQTIQSCLNLNRV